MPNPIFGDWEGAPIADESPTIPTPIGTQCANCGDPFKPGDAGMRMGHIGIDAESAIAEDWHRECLFLTTCGHTFGICTCTGWDTRTREAARAAWARRSELDGDDE